jgi:pilus assembly protein CpaB
MATTKVVVAARDIDLGTQLTPDMLKQVDWPSSSAVNGIHKDVQELDTRVVNTMLLRGEPILDSKLAPRGTKGGLSAVIGTGKRAITVRVNEVSGVAGFSLPGNYVDLMVNTNDEREKPISKIVLEKILVLAVAQESSRDETKPKVVNAVTLEVTPEQAERLDLARSVGTLSLALRNQVDHEDIATSGARKADLLAANEVPAPVKAAPAAGETKPAAATPKKVAKPARKAASKAPSAAPAPDKDRVEVIKGMQKSDVSL